MRRNRIDVLLTLALVLSALSFSCGGGGGGGGGGPVGLTATFTPTNANPPAGTVSLQPGASNGPSFSIEVRVQDPTNFMGTSFHLTFATASATFVSMSSANSFIAGAGITTDFHAQLDSTPGVLLLDAERIGQVQGATGVGSQLLMTLNFRATAATAGNTFGFNSTQVTTCPAPPAACTDSVGSFSGGLLTAN